MSKIELKDYQKNAMKFAIKVPRCALCIKTGKGKTLITMFTMRYLFKHKLINKCIIACTKSSITVYQDEFKEKFGMDIEYIQTGEEYLNFYKNNSKICLIKHSMFKSVGCDIKYLKELNRISKQKNIKVAMIVDEAHKISSHTGVQHKGFLKLRPFLDRIILATATPFSSSLVQLYGLINLIQSNLYKTVKEFEDRYIDYLEIRNHKGKIAQKIILRYKNLKELRSKICSFFYFYYPPTNLNYEIETAELPESEYQDYLKLCRGLLDIGEIDTKNNG